jgi:hypothetical protein
MKHFFKTTLATWFVAITYTARNFLFRLIA